MKFDTAAGDSRLRHQCHVEPEEAAGVGVVGLRVLHAHPAGDGGGGDVPRAAGGAEADAEAGVAEGVSAEDFQFYLRGDGIGQEDVQCQAGGGAGAGDGGGRGAGGAVLRARD